MPPSQVARGSNGNAKPGTNAPHVTPISAIALQREETRMTKPTDEFHRVVGFKMQDERLDSVAANQSVMANAIASRILHPATR